MGRLLLRSVKTEETASRIDIFFMRAVHVNLPMILRSVNIAEVAVSSDLDPGERQAFRASMSTSDLEMKLLRIQSGTCNGFVIAAGFSVGEDHGEYWEPSQFAMEP